LQQVDGSVWNGRAEQVLASNGRDLGRLQWELSHRALLGRVEVQFDFHGQLRKLSAAQVVWSGVQARVNLSALADPRLRLPLGQPQGEFDLGVGHALLQGGWPLEMQAGLQWRQAALRTPDGEVSLGDLHGQASAQNGVIHAQWQDDGQGPLRTTGELQLSPLGWRLTAELQARHDDPILRRWLAALGRPGADGTVHVEHRGGLAASTLGNTAR